MRHEENVVWTVWLSHMKYQLCRSEWSRSQCHIVHPGMTAVGFGGMRNLSGWNGQQRFQGGGRNGARPRCRLWMDRNKEREERGERREGGDQPDGLAGDLGILTSGYICGPQEPGEDQDPRFGL